MSVIGIDLGGAYSVIAQAQKGGIKTVLNGASQRRSSTLVSINGKERALASNADTMIKSNYKNTVWYINRLIGRTLGLPDTEKELSLLPYAKMFGESKKTPGQLVATLKVDGEDEEFTATQLLAMLIGQLQRDAIAGTPGVKTSDVVISVPAWYTDAQRHEVLAACEVANVACLGVMSDTTAVALNYGIWKNQRKAFDGEEKFYVMFINMGATQYTVSIVHFKTGTMRVLSTTHDRFLGGRIIDIAIANKLVAEFKAKTGLDASREAAPKAYIKLLIAAEKAKKNLCGGVPSVKINVECLMNDRDLANVKLTREELDEICAPLADRMMGPIQQALNEVGIQNSELKSVEATGGALRMAVFKKKVGSFFGFEAVEPNYGLMTTMDMDESAGHGCALQCAMISPKFNVKAFEIQHGTQYPITISWDQPDVVEPSEENKMEVEEEEGEAGASSEGVNSLTLFSKNSISGTRKINFRRNKAFTLEATYSDAVVNDQGFPGGSQHIAKFTISGMPTAGTSGEVPRVRVFLTQDSNGILRAQSALYMEEKIEKADEDVAMKDESKEGEAQDDKKEAAEGEAAKKEEDEQKKTGDEGEKEEPKKKKKKFKRVNLKVDAVYTGMPARHIIVAQQSREANMAQVDRIIRETHDARNDLETFVYDFRDKLDRQLSQFAADEEKQNINDRLAKEEDWLYTEEADDAKKKIFVSKLDDLKALTKPIEQREVEANGRPNACNQLRTLTESYLTIVNGSDEKYAHLSVEDRDEVRNCCNSAQQWLSDQQEKQQILPLSADPVLLVGDISKRWSEVDNKCKPIVNKKKPEPVKEEEAKKTEAADSKTEETADGETNPEGESEAPSKTDAEQEKTEDAEQSMDVDKE